MKNWLATLLTLLLLFAPCTIPQGGETAGLELANTFQRLQTYTQGVALGNTGGLVTLTAAAQNTSYNLVLPGSGGISGYYLCVGATPGTWTYCGVGGSPAVTFTPSSLNFGSVHVTTSSTNVVVLSNSGNSQLTISSISIAGSTTFTQTNTCGATLDAGATCSISVTFTPTSSQTFTGTLSVTDNATGSPQTANLTGTGDIAQFSIISISPTSGPDGTVATVTGTGFISSAIVTFTMTSTGTMNLPTTFVNSTTLTVTVPFSFVVGTYTVGVTQ